MSRITFSGLASGIDTNALVDQLVQLESEPILRKEKRIEKLGQVKDAWRDINMRLNHLREALQGMMVKDNFQSMKVGSTEPSLVSATAESGAEPATYGLQVSQVATYHTLTMQSDIQTTLNKGVGEALGLSGIFSIKDLTADEGGTVEIEIEGTDSLTSIKNKINEADVGVTASIFAGHLILKSDKTGTENEIELAYISGDNVLDELGIVEKVGAQDAHFSMNGFDFVRSSNEVDDIIENVTFYLSGVTTAPVYVEIGADIERAIESITAFVEQYNSVNHIIRERLEHRNEVSEDRDSSIGLLQGDTTLMKIERSLRTLVNSPMPDARYQDEEGNWQIKKYHSLSSLGVVTFDKEGYLQFNENTLAAALQDDPEGVFSVLKFEEKDENGFGTGQFNGVTVQLDNYLKRLLVTDQDSQGRPLQPISVQREAAVQRRIDELYRRINIREQRLLSYEERLIRQFTAMERYISTMQAQSQELENMIGQMAGFGGNK